MRLTRVPTRTARLLVVSIGLLALAGCTGDETPAPPASASEQPADTAATTDRIQSTLAARDDVASVEVAYKDDLVNPSTGRVQATMEPGADPQAVYDDAVRLVWQSDLEPLSTIMVSVIDPEDPPRGIGQVLNLRDEATSGPLQQQYGPRPE